jgi:hypothetical protein
MGEPDLSISNQNDEIGLSQYKTQLFNSPARLVEKEAEEV